LEWQLDGIALVYQGGVHFHTKHAGAERIWAKRLSDAAMGAWNQPQAAIAAVGGIKRDPNC
jgi:hypothetical protein